MGGGWPQPLVGLALLATPVARDVRRIFGMFITNLLPMCCRSFLH